MMSKRNAMDCSLWARLAKCGSEGYLSYFFIITLFHIRIHLPSPPHSLFAQHPYQYESCYDYCHPQWASMNYPFIRVQDEKEKSKRGWRIWIGLTQHLSLVFLPSLSILKEEEKYFPIFFFLQQGFSSSLPFSHKTFTIKQFACKTQGLLSPWAIKMSWAGKSNSSKHHAMAIRIHSSTPVHQNISKQRQLLTLMTIIQGNAVERSTYSHW